MCDRSRLEGDHIARWKLAAMLAAYQTDPMMDAVDLKVQLELWAGSTRRSRC